MDEHVEYGNWIRKKNLMILGASALGMGALLFIPLGSFYRIAVGVLFLGILFSFLFPLYAFVMFSPKGGKIQEKIYHLILQRLRAKGNGRFLDIGSGNGMLAILIARQFPESEVVGVDSWGRNWEYSRSVCERNAHAARVKRRVIFQEGDAAMLAFADGAFDGVMSNLTFHEVKSVPDKRRLVREALRVLKPGGAFVFIDYFYEEKYYGNASAFEGYLRSLHLAQWECKPLRNMLAVPFLMNHPKIFGRVGVIFGVK